MDEATTTDEADAPEEPAAETAEAPVTDTAEAESVAEAAAPDLEGRVADLEAAVIALGGPDRIPIL